jgi:hypothetical protein
LHFRNRASPKVGGVGESRKPAAEHWSLGGPSMPRAKLYSKTVKGCASHSCLYACSFGELGIA